MENETYLGDGLYASFDGWQIKLRTPRESGNHEVFLEPSVFENLVIFGEKIKREWSLNAGDSAAFMAALETPPEPNEALKAAATRYLAEKP